jgi:hypothetical protein
VVFSMTQPKAVCFCDPRELTRASSGTPRTSSRGENVMKEAIPFDGGLIAYRSEATMIVVQHSFEDMRNVQGDVKAGLDPLIFGILAGETKAFLVESIVPRQDFEGSWWVKGKLDINESGYLMVLPGHENPRPSP